MKRVCVLPGDGVGPEVVGCAARVLETVAPSVELVGADIGRVARARYGSSLPDETLQLMRTCDSTLFGAVTTPSDPGEPSPVLTFRKELGLYANVRPVKTFVTSPGRPPIDVVIVRENSEGLYNQPETAEGDSVFTRRRVSRGASERIVDYAIDFALSHGRTRVCCVHKANVLRMSDGLFVDTFRERMSRRGKALVPQEQLVDSAAMHLVTEPSRFDVIVTLNLYGDILSDVAAGTAGGLGFAPSGNIGERHSVFEPAHGSAPDIVGKGVANPTATILSAAMMLDHIGMRAEGKRVAEAVASVFASGDRTTDVGGRLGSDGLTAAVIGRLGA